jgi:hypothetical protein
MIRRSGPVPEAEAESRQRRIGSEVSGYLGD